MLDSVNDDAQKGISIRDDILQLDPKVWILKKKASLKGKSGINHHVDFYCESKDGGKIIILKADKDYVSIYEIIGKVQILTTEEYTDMIFIMCSCDVNHGNLINAMKMIGATIIKNFRFGSELFTADSEKSLVKDSIGRRNTPGTMRLRRDRMRIMLDVMELLNEHSSRITNIIYKCNLNYRTANELLDELIKKNYVQLRKDNENESSYSLTKAGSDALQSVRKMYSA
ncbi:MAG: hypothetical protein AMDU1_APLC00033G0021 [Thermoplasmatales archaeon A-plasma]|jgi:predicted transcriptional regulator|nr:MAG: hypothetical protein AMDU5_GPLC00016G0014 [Thermoplasmatales archaeon Gpl]EQB71170.1 MAG: hypothetical protein AMDU1_APLC00033G0021 [Thermoplasmatales archaeon A-plasma]WMT45355.1 MAG: winged helix-turn-helix domain-containing protein [Cuniculiplasma divulgatum]